MLALRFFVRLAVHGPRSGTVGEVLNRDRYPRTEVPCPQCRRMQEIMYDKSPADTRMKTPLLHKRLTLGSMPVDARVSHVKKAAKIEIKSATTKGHRLLQSPQSFTCNSPPVSVETGLHCTRTATSCVDKGQFYG